MDLRQLSPKDTSILQQIDGLTMTSVERVVALTSAVRHIVKRQIEGAMVECGVWRGGSMMAVALALQQELQGDRELYLYDTYEGMPPPSEADNDNNGRSAESILASADRLTSHCWAYSRIEEVQNNIHRTGYEPSRIHFVKGLVEETIPSVAPDKIALLRLDTDWYSSTKHELAHLYPRLSVGGVLIIDDYGHWTGAKKAVDEFFSTLTCPPLLMRIDYTGRIAVKDCPA